MSRFDPNRAPYRHRIHWASSQGSNSHNGSNSPGPNSPGEAHAHSYGDHYADTRSIEYLIDLAQCESRKVLRLNAYWQQIAQDGLPTRHSLDPGKIRDLLANVMIIELHDDPLRLRYRLVGTAISAAMGRDVTGKWLDEVITESGKAASFLNLFEQLREKRAPIFGQTVNSRERRGCHNFHWAIFPLRDDNDQISHALMIEDYDNLAISRVSATGSSARL